MYKVLQGNRNFYYLFDVKIAMPCLLVLRYCEANLHMNSGNYQRSELEAIKAFYSFWLEKHGLTLDYSFYQSNYQGVSSLLDEMDAFWEYLLAGRTLDNVVLLSRVSTPALRLKRTSAARCSSVLRFIDFLAHEYINSHYFAESRQDIERHLKFVELKINDNKKKFHKSGSASYNGNTSDILRSLTRDQFMDLTKVFTPSLTNNNPLNPVSSVEIQIRNYLLMTLMSRYGLRIGEALLLHKESFKPFKSDPNKYLMLVRNLEDESMDIEDLRKNKLSIKNKQSVREIEITKQHYALIFGYFNKMRPTIAEHEYILTSHKKPYFPLSYATAYEQFKNCIQSFKQNFPEHFNAEYAESIEGSISPHWLRHTWAYSTLSMEYTASKDKFTLHGVVNVKGIMEDAIDKLRVLGGWSTNSKLPQRYAKRFVRDNANQTLLDIFTEYQSPSIEDDFYAKFSR